MLFTLHERVRSTESLCPEIDRGTPGAVVHSFPDESSPEAYLVEFFDRDGETIDVVKVTPDQIVPEAPFGRGQ